MAYVMRFSEAVNNGPAIRKAEAWRALGLVRRMRR